MKVLLDTNILLRGCEPQHIHYLLTKQAAASLVKRGFDFCISAQSISEFLAVATRSPTHRGLGMTSAYANAELTRLVSSLHVYHDSPDVITELRRLVVAHAVVGKSVHDTRLVATMNTYGITHLLTLNAADFTRFTGITVLDPTAMPS